MIFYSLNINKITKDMEEHIKTIYPKRYERSMKYVDRKDQLLSLGAYILLEKAIGKFNEKDIKYSKKGKPFIKDKPFFNYSHSNEYVCLVKSKKEVGIDIQFIENKDKNQIKEWTIKEAIWKLCDDGISLHKPIPNEYNNKQIKIKTKLFRKDYYLTIATI